LFTYELSRRLAGTGITANVLHPGFVATNFGKSNGGIYVPVFDVAHLGAISPKEGAKTMLHLASSPLVDGVSGKYFVQSKEARSSRESYDLTVAARLWDASERLTA
jgi:NAD(P)-dependent dehydrogenase (short-subunit alcohol dehydrogenase family)